MPHDIEPKDLAKYRLEQARECLRDAENAIGTSSKNAANRSYYTIFHSMRAVLALERFDSKKHSGVISAFRQRYIKTGVFEPFFSDVVRNAFIVRNRCDYEDFFVVSKSEVEKQIDNARQFLEAVEAYIDRLV